MTARPTAPHLLFVTAGGAGLAALAGWLNAVMLGIYHIPVSHMTGATARIGIDLAAGDSKDLLLAASILLAFLMGAIVSGAIVGDARLVPGRRYGIVLLVEAVALAVAAWLGGAPDGMAAAVPLTAFACGLQNGMAASWYGLVIRTTHVTGIVTDLGALIGRRLRGLPVRSGDLGLLLTLWMAFFAGGWAGAVTQRQAGSAALWAAAAAAGASGAGYAAWRMLRPSRAMSPPV